MTLRLAALLAMGLAMGLLVAAPASAGLFDDDEARQRIVELRGKIVETQDRADTLSRNQLDFANQIEALRAELARLRGQVEVLTHNIEATQKRQQDFYVDLDTRLRALEKAAAAAAAAPPAPPPPNDTADYEAALNALKAASHKEAAAAFDQFIARHPQSSLLASAHYWGAYAHGQLKETLAASGLLATFVERWPDDERAPEALERRVDHLTSAKDLKGARAALEQLARQYPATDAGKRAKQRLAKK